MNAKISVFVISVEAIIYLLLHNLHDCTFNDKAYFQFSCFLNTVNCTIVCFCFFVCLFVLFVCFEYVLCFFLILHAFQGKMKVSKTVIYFKKKKKKKRNMQINIG